MYIDNATMQLIKDPSLI
ncbi:hypothetical protein OH492_22745 [Vibrio chagasii]|nr:hypothetical protein [Vibrio chagasii]